MWLREVGKMVPQLRDKAWLRWVAAGTREEGRWKAGREA